MQKTLKENQVQVWIIDLKKIDQIPLSFFRCQLNEEELIQSKQLVSIQDRQRYLISHGVLQNLLKDYLNSNKSFEFVKNENGKLALAANPLYFNLSHSNDFVLLAFSKKNPVGVDIEKMNLNRNLLSIAERFFCEAEAKEMLSLPLDNQGSFFYSLWSQKEALIKAKGLNLLSLKDVKQDAFFCLSKLNIHPEYQAFLAHSKEDFQIDLHYWSVE